MRVKVFFSLTGAERGLLHCASRDLVLYRTISTNKALDILATMASHGDIAEGGTNEEFNDIIKWRSGMFLLVLAFIEAVILRLYLMFVVPYRSCHLQTV